MALPNISKLFVREQGDMSVGQRFVQALERGSRHNGVAEPIHAAEEDARSVTLHLEALLSLSFARFLHGLERSGGGFPSQVFWHLPAVVDPEPIGGIA